MAWRVLGQVSPTGGQRVPAYVVPPDSKTTVSTIHVCNRGLDTSFRVGIAIENETETGAQWLYYDEFLGANRAFAITTGITLSEGDVLYVQSASGHVSFNVFGVERADG